MPEKASATPHSAIIRQLLLIRNLSFESSTESLNIQRHKISYSTAAMSYSCSSIAHPEAPAINVTSLIYERYQNAPKDDWGRLLKCWGITDCGDCHRSNGSCGWCPIVRYPSIELLPNRYVTC